MDYYSHEGEMPLPYSVQVEVVEGCDKRCHFCGIHALKRKINDVRLADPAKAWKLAKKIEEFNPQARIEIAMHGEPTLHPELAWFVNKLRKYLTDTQIQMTTNGKSWLGHFEESALKIFNAGCNLIVCDTYKPERDELRKELRRAKNITVLDFYKDCKISPWANHRLKLKRTVIMLDDLGECDGITANRQIMNQGGNSIAKPRLDVSLDKTCTLPFRELAIRYDGDVCVCCDDWKREYLCGNIYETDHILDVWNGKKFKKARLCLGNKWRCFMPCQVCDRKSGARAGLLPKVRKLDSSERRSYSAVFQRSPK